MDKLNAQLALSCMLLLPPAMRTSRIATMLAEAMGNPALARELQEHPRQVFEERCGYIIPAATAIEVHISTPDSIHMVVPRSPGSAEPAETTPEITDEDLISESLFGARDLTAVAKAPPREAYVKAGK